MPSSLASRAVGDSPSIDGPHDRGRLAELLEMKSLSKCLRLGRNAPRRSAERGEHALGRMYRRGLVSRIVCTLRRFCLAALTRRLELIPKSAARVCNLCTAPVAYVFSDLSSPPCKGGLQGGCRLVANTGAPEWRPSPSASLPGRGGAGAHAKHEPGCKTVPQGLMG